MDSAATQWIPTYKNEKEVYLRIKMSVRKFALMYAVQKWKKKLHLFYFQFFKESHTVLHSGCTSLYSHF